MLAESTAFSGFSVDDIAAARVFYGEVLGLRVDVADGMLHLWPGGGSHIIVYSKDDHVPATFTVLNFPVADVDAAVDRLGAAGIEMERYPGMDHDERGVVRHPDAPPIAWFTDPAGNVLSVLEV